MNRWDHVADPEVGNRNGTEVDHSQSLFYFVPQEKDSHSQAGLTRLRAVEDRGWLTLDNWKWQLSCDEYTTSDTYVWHVTTHMTHNMWHNMWWDDGELTIENEEWHSTGGLVSSLLVQVTKMYITTVIWRVYSLWHIWHITRDTYNRWHIWHVMSYDRWRSVTHLTYGFTSPPS